MPRFLTALAYNARHGKAAHTTVTHTHTLDNIKDIQIGTFLTSFPSASCDVCTKGVKLWSSEVRLQMTRTHNLPTKGKVSNFEGSLWIATV